MNKNKEIEALEQRIRESEKRLGEISDHIPGAVFQFLLRKDGSYSFPYISQRAFNIFGARPSDIEKDAALVFDRFFPEDRKRINEAVAESARTLQKFSIEHRVRKRDGELAYYRVAGIPHREKNGDTLWNAVALDITDQVKARQASKESEAIYRSVFENTGTATVIIEPDRTISMANGEFERLSGYSKEEIENKRKWTEFVGKEDLERMEQYHDQRRLKNDSAPHEYEFRFVDKQGNEKHILNTVAMIPGSSKSVASLMDITSRKRAEIELRETELKFRILAEQSPNMIFINKGGRVVYVNNRCVEIMGYSRKEIYSSGFDFMCLIAEDSAALIRENMKRHLKGEDLAPYEYGLVTRAGRRIEALITTKLIDYEGERAILGIITDITERKAAESALKESEKRYRALFEKAGDAIFILEAETANPGKILAANQKAADLHGYPVDELLCMNIRDLDTPESIADIPERIQRILDGEWLHFEATHRKKDGTIFPVEVSAGLVDFGNRAFIMALERDISQRMQDAEERKTLEHQLHRAQRIEAIGTLAGGIAHDFNNILSAIIGYTEIAGLNVPEDGRAKKPLKEVLKAGYRARDLVNQILAFSRQSDHEKKAVDMIPIAKEALKLLRATLPSTIEIEQAFAPESAHILADPTQVHQILMNLCTNAGHAMRDKGGRLTVSIEEVELRDDQTERESDLSAGPYVRLKVRDTGLGIAPDLLPRIFDPYFTTKEKGLGTGLGLAVTHGIVKELGGFISVRSEPGKGSSFEIFLPVAEKTEPEMGEAYETLVMGNERILFVDDEAAVLDSGRQILELLGYEVVTSDNPVDALETFRQDPDRFDLVITDQTMPGLTGDEFARALMKIRPEIPIVLCTGFSEVMDEEKARRMGIRAFVMKPIIMKQMADTIRSVLGSD